MRDQVVQIALQHPEMSPGELAWHITDTQGYFLSESSVYRILKAFDLITSPAFVLVKAADTFKHPTKRVSELWQTDFSQFKVVGWVIIISPPCWMTSHATSLLGSSRRDGIRHTRSAPYHPQTQGKIERYHRSIKNVICLEHHYFPWQLEQAIAAFVEHYNTQPYHEALGHLTPADMFFGRAAQIETQRAVVKRRALALRRTQHVLAQSSA